MIVKRCKSWKSNNWCHCQKKKMRIRQRFRKRLKIFKLGMKIVKVIKNGAGKVHLKVMGLEGKGKTRHQVMSQKNLMIRRRIKKWRRIREM